MTSAKDNINIEAAMVRLYHKIDKEKKIINNVATIVLGIKKVGEEKKSNCRC